MSVIRINVIQFHRAKRENTVLSVIVHAMEIKVYLLTYLRERIPWGNFRGNHSSWASFFMFFCLFCLHRALYKIHRWKLIAHGKIKSRGESLVKKRKKETGPKKAKGEPFCKEKKKILCEGDWYWRNSTLASRFPFYLSDKYQPWYKIIKNRLKV